MDTEITTAFIDALLIALGMVRRLQSEQAEVKAALETELAWAERLERVLNLATPADLEDCAADAAELHDVQPDYVRSVRMLAAALCVVKEDRDGS